MSKIEEYVLELGKKAKKVAPVLAGLSSKKKNEILLEIAENLENEEEKIMTANSADLEAAKKNGMKESLLDRLVLTKARIHDMAHSLRELVKLEDPIGEVERMWRRPNGLQIGQVRAPLGVVGIIYESRPNVTVDAAALALKTGNAIILRGGSEALHSNTALVELMRKALAALDLPPDAVQLVQSTDREAARALMQLHGYLDLLIPRGGAGLIRTVVENSSVPVIETGVGNCHIFVDDSADPEKARAIVLNAKVQRPSVCNALETLLVHEKIASIFLPLVGQDLKDRGVELRGCRETKAILPWVREATEEDYGTEYLDLVLAVKVVDSIDEAISHIAQYGSKHSESILTNDYAHARRFLQEVDAAAVYVNASTRFTDGFEFGFGAELGISTQKLHARGPMGLHALTTLKYVILGDGQVRE
ncbi:MAG TPA: glutamate-5-semialdehyde dehydrogenase [Firmicutes bacterium]|nr:glutamate-5-semialdehyde dehydrogenase [Bacillota bacterium]